MNFHQFEYIIAVDRHKHFAKAAESCHITQATLSAMIKKLEDELNTLIFDRSRQPVKTTSEGEKIIEKAKAILDIRTEMMFIHATDDASINGSISLGIIPTIANALLPMVLKPLIESFPNLNIQIHEITTEEIIRQLKSDELDVGILATPLNDTMIHENVLYNESMMVYGITDSDRDFVMPKDIQDQNIWLLEEGHCFRNQSKTICDIQEKQNQPDNFEFQGNSFETLLNLTDQLGGYTLIPELYFKSLSAKRKTKTKGFVKPIPVREVSMVYYRPYAKKSMIDNISAKISALVEPHLMTKAMDKKDITVVGI